MRKESKTKLQGTSGMIKVMDLLSDLGCSVLLPIDERLPYDLVVDRNGKLEKIQVKTAEEKNGVIRVKMYTSSKSHYKKYEEKDFDWLILYEVRNKKFYFLSSKMVNDNTTIQLRTSIPKNGQMRGVRWAKDFLNW